jgi:RNA polymerase sigma factor (sigma-70 family)
MLAVLVRLFGLSQVQIAEDIVQDTLLAAFETWKMQGVPDNPKAWLYRIAKNKTIDFLRRERNFRDKIAPNFPADSVQDLHANTWLDAYFDDDEMQDAQLRMMFACCHPAIPLEAQLVLVLRSLCGLNVREIAAALLLPEDTVAKRIFRAKEKMREVQAVLEVPSGSALLSRLDAVLLAIYLLFNEGYKSATEASVIRRELCEEAMRLGGLLTRHPVTNLTKTHALQALLCFQASRFDARLDTEGHVILLEHQDRRLWNRGLIAVAYEHFKESTQRNDVSEYHLEAAIASYHASAPSFEATNWKAIFYCYDLLLRLKPSPVVALNRAIAVGFAEGPKHGIEALLKIEGLAQYHLYHTALGDFYLKNDDLKMADTAYKTALKWVQLPAEQRVIEQKLKCL